MNIRELFEKLSGDDNGDEYLMFDRIEKKLSTRPDMHAFIMLDKLVPGNRDMVSAAEHDQIWLAVSIDDLESVASTDEVIDLYRCGVFLDDDGDSLTMFA